MTIEALRWAFNQKLVGSEKAVLLVLADHTDQSETCYPAIKRISYRGGVSVSSVRRALEKLEAEGYIRKVHRERFNGSSTSNRYFLNLDFGVQVDPMRADREVNEEEGVTMTPRVSEVSLSASSRGGVGITMTPSPRRGDTPNNHQQKPQKNTPAAGAAGGVDEGLFPDTVKAQAKASPAPAVRALFEDFWAAYPRKEDRGAGLKAWTKAVKAGVDPGMLEAQAAAYSAQVARDNKDRAFVKKAHNWIVDEAYANDYAAPSTAAGSSGGSPRSTSANSWMIPTRKA